MCERGYNIFRDFSLLYFIFVVDGCERIRFGVVGFGTADTAVFGDILYLDIVAEVHKTAETDDIDFHDTDIGDVDCVSSSGRGCRIPGIRPISHYNRNEFLFIHKTNEKEQIHRAIYSPFGPPCSEVQISG